MFSTLNLSYKNLKETTPKKMMLNHYSRMENMKKMNELALKKSLELSKNADPDKIENVSKIMYEHSAIDATNNGNENNIDVIDVKLYDNIYANNLINNLQENEITNSDILNLKINKLIENSNKLDINLYDTSKFNSNSNSNFNSKLIENVRDLNDNGKNENHANSDNVTLKINQLMENSNKFAINLYDNTILTLNGSGKNNNRIIPYNVDRIKKKGIKTIHNVYQSKYNYGKTNANGLGDFIRGCYFMLEFCDENNFEYKIIFNNIIANFLKIKTHNLVNYSKILNGITYFKNNNFLQNNIVNAYILEPIKNSNVTITEFIEYIDKTTSYNGNVFICNNSYPRYDIQEKHKEYMKTILEPTDEMKEIIKQRTKDLYISYKKYIVIHVRCGDSYLKKESSEFKTNYISKLINMINQDINNGNNGNNENNVYLLISDNNEIKYMLKKVFRNFKVFINPITHFGEGVELEEENVKNTLTDFYLFSLAKKICSYSVYPHGSGFSYWCAKTYNIPYFCKYLN